MPKYAVRCKIQDEGQMNSAAEYRANAEICRRMADKTPNERDKSAWLEMARSWSFLTKLEDVVPSDELNAAAAREHGADQFSPIVRDIRKKWPRMALALGKVVSGLGAKLDAAFSSISTLLK
jgi:hypothetical protein